MVSKNTRKMKVFCCVFVALVTFGVQIGMAWAFRSVSISTWTGGHTTRQQPYRLFPRVTRTSYGNNLVLKAMTKGLESSYIYYSQNFHRHVFISRERSFESFLWFDQAREIHPNATLLPFPTSDPAGPVYIAGTGFGTNENPYKLVNSTLPIGANVERSILYSYKQVIEKLHNETVQAFGFSYLDQFPPQDQPWIRERVLFLLSPKREQELSFGNSNGQGDLDIDWPKEFSKGYGAGFTVEQTIKVIQALPHFLSIHPKQTGHRKKSLLFFYQSLQISIELMREAQEELEFWLAGAEKEDLATFAYLRTLGISWEQCRIVLSAFSTSIVSCDIIPRVEFYRPGSPVRSHLNEESLLYLRMKLHLSPSEIFAFLCSHSRLSFYTPSMIRSHLEILQETTSISMQDLRRLILRSPAILGSAPDKVAERVEFLVEEAGVAQSDLVDVLTRQPSLLQSNIENNLRPKLAYLQDELQISQQNIGGLVVSNPRVLASSLGGKIIPMMDGLSDICDLTKSETGALLIRMPELMNMSWKSNIRQKAQFLMTRLGITNQELGTIVSRAPRILIQSIEGSLEPKLRMIETVLKSGELSVEAVKENPSLLLCSKPYLRKRLGRILSSLPTEAQPQPHQVNIKTGRGRPSKPVFVFQGGNLVETYGSLSLASSAVGLSAYKLKKLIENCEIFEGKRYTWESPSESDAEEHFSNSIAPEIESGDDNRENVTASYSKVADALISTSSPTIDGCREKHGKQDVVFRIYVGGRSFPPERSNIVKGRKKVGGLSAFFPQMQGPVCGAILQKAFAELVGLERVVSDVDDSSDFERGLVLWTFPLERPSRNRCSLYAVRDALRLVSIVIYSQRSCQVMKDLSVKVEIVTDSSYVHEILSDTKTLERFGEYATRVDFQTGEQENLTPASNPDILHPLSRTFRSLQDQLFKGGPVAQKVEVNFLHTSDLRLRSDGLHQSSNISRSGIDPYALKAAQYVHEVSRRADLRQGIFVY